jgi:hypothetical protein
VHVIEPPDIPIVQVPAPVPVHVGVVVTVSPAGIVSVTDTVVPFVGTAVVVLTTIVKLAVLPCVNTPPFPAVFTIPKVGAESVYGAGLVWSAGSPPPVTCPVFVLAAALLATFTFTVIGP